MTTSPLPFALRRKRLIAMVIAVSVLFVGGYVMLLNHEERVMESYYQELRKSNPELYLSKIMQARGFKTFLKEYLVLHDYAHPTTIPPSFLVGRWALFDEAKRVSDSFVPDTCVSGLEVEDGHIKLFGVPGADANIETDFGATYTMAGDRVTAHLGGDRTATIDVIGYGSRLHHIELHLPGNKPVRYGYMCR